MSIQAQAMNFATSNALANQLLKLGAMYGAKCMTQSTVAKTNTTVSERLGEIADGDKSMASLNKLATAQQWAPAVGAAVVGADLALTAVSSCTDTEGVRTVAKLVNEHSGEVTAGMTALTGLATAWATKVCANMVGAFTQLAKEE
jgi:hypothetical protein